MRLDRLDGLGHRARLAGDLEQRLQLGADPGAKQLVVVDDEDAWGS